jgi:hypothetical protein
MMGHMGQPNGIYKMLTGAVFNSKNDLIAGSDFILNED